MNESETRRKKIDPQLYDLGWEQVPDSVILTEQRAYLAPGEVNEVPENRHPKKVDYILEYRKRKLAVIEAKPDTDPVEKGIDQAKKYADLLKIRYTYSCNGDKIWFIDMGVKDENGNYIEPSKEHPVDKFPTPKELWAMTFKEPPSILSDTFNSCVFNRGGGKQPRYYQEIAINSVMEAVARKQNRILLTMATGTGKTYTAFQICWKLYETGWNTKGTGLKPNILFISDRNILANQATNDFEQFPSDIIERVTPKLLHDKEHNDHVPTSRNIYFTIFQTVMGCPPNESIPYYQQWPRDFFDFIIIDECHRGGANDESEWRDLMRWFEPAYQLGMTATPRRQVNVNTYNYFGNPVYTYSLKQGIEDGFLTPFRVQFAESPIDEYEYDPDDDVEGDIDTEKTYTEVDFYKGNIEIRQRDEHRVKEFLSKIDPNEKTLVFCANQNHALQIMGMINQYKRVPDNNYCERVTANDGDKGEEKLKQFQDNEKLRPTILTTSRKLSTGVDARNVRNIVLMRPVKNMVEFKQIMGRGTRLFEGKYFFTILDFVGASDHFGDPDWDGDPFCPVCGNFPCSCHKRPSGGGGIPHPPCPPAPCPVCGHLPCTCDGGQSREKVVVKLSPLRSVTLLTTKWTERIQYGDEMLTLQEYLKRLFGELPHFIDGEEDLREKWSKPNTRKELLNLLERAGFPEDKLETARRLLQYDKCDMLDFLAFLAYNTTPMERERRASILREDRRNKLAKQQMEFMDFILDTYVENGFKELWENKIKTLAEIKYGTVADAVQQLHMDVDEIRTFFFALQWDLYNSPSVVNYNIHNHFNGAIDNLTIKGK
jgi:type I restriction enzyme R subunit